MLEALKQLCCSFISLQLALPDALAELFKAKANIHTASYANRVCGANFHSMLLFKLLTCCKKTGIISLMDVAEVYYSRLCS